jgi:hypothetical protein
VDRAKEVADQAIPMGPQTQPVITPQAIMGGLGVAAGIAAATKGGSQGAGSGASPPLTPIPSDPLPGIIPRAGGSGGGTAASSSSGGTAVSGSGSGSLPASSPLCAQYSNELKKLVQVQQQLTQQATAASNAGRGGEARAKQLACQLVANSEKMLSVMNQAKSAGCGVSIQISQEALQYQLQHFRSLCR